MLEASIVENRPGARGLKKCAWNYLRGLSGREFALGGGIANARTNQVRAIFSINKVRAILSINEGAGLEAC